MAHRFAAGEGAERAHWPALDTAAKDGLVHRALLPVTIGLCILYVFFIATDLFARPPPLGRVLLPADVACLAVFAALALAAWRGRIERAWSQATLGVIALILVASVGHLFVADPDPVHTLYLMLLAVAAGSLLLSWVWYGTATAVAMGAWLLVATETGLDQTWMNFGFGLAAAVGVGGMLHANRLRTFARIHALHDRDARARVELEATLAAARLNEERFQRLTAASQDIASDWNVRDGTLWWSESFYARLGYPRRGHADTLAFWSQRIHPLDRRRVVASLEAALAGDDGSWTDEYRLQRADGGYLHVLDRRQVLRDGAGRPTHVVGFMTDVTDAREAEDRLRSEKDLYRALLEALGQAGHALALVEGGRLVYANAAGREALSIPNDGSRGAVIDAALVALEDDGGRGVELPAADGSTILAHALERGAGGRVLLVAERAPTARG